MSRTARGTRSSPKRTERASPIHALTANGDRRIRNNLRADAMTEATNISPQARQPRASRRSHTRRSGHPRSSVGSVAVSSPRQCDKRHWQRPPKRPAPSIRLPAATSPVTAIQTHPSRSARASKNGAPNPQCCPEPSNTQGVRSHSRTRPPKRPGTYRPEPKPLSLLQTLAATSATNLPPANSQKDAPSDEHNTDPHLPEGRRGPVFEPIGRSRTTSPMGFDAFRRNQRR